MNTTHKTLLTMLVFLIASCSSVSTDRTNDATAISASASGAYSDNGLTSNNILYFAYDRSDINSEGRAKIRTLAKLIKDNDLSVRVEGHCDERGTREYNMALGERRAKTVKEYLVLQGVAASSMEVISYGEERAASFGSNESSWRMNRRVELKN